MKRVHKDIYASPCSLNAHNEEETLQRDSWFVVYLLRYAKATISCLSVLLLLVSHSCLLCLLCVLRSCATWGSFGRSWPSTQLRNASHASHICAAAQLCKNIWLTLTFPAFFISIPNPWPTYWSGVTYISSVIKRTKLIFHLHYRLTWFP